LESNILMVLVLELDFAVFVDIQAQVYNLVIGI
jgi:hypothetical protein